jgi:hypothetical protein
MVIAMINAKRKTMGPEAGLTKRRRPLTRFFAPGTCQSTVMSNTLHPLSITDLRCLNSRMNEARVDRLGTPPTSVAWISRAATQANVASILTLKLSMRG